MNSRLAEHLRQRVNRGEARSVRICKDSAGFKPEITECHARVDKWVETHPGHKPIRGWAVTRTSMGLIFDRHSLVDIGGADLVDIDPRQNPITFLVGTDGWDGPTHQEIYICYNSN
jgi:hypothetical protein